MHVASIERTKKAYVATLMKNKIDPDSSQILNGKQDLFFGGGNHTVGGRGGGIRLGLIHPKPNLF